MNAKEITRDDLKDHIGQPVWYQSLDDVNDFGWAFIHPETNTAGYAMLILPKPRKKNFFSWSGVRLYDRPAIKGICSRCKWQRKDLTRCALAAEGKKPRCTFEEKFADFEPTPFYKQMGYTANTFMRQLKTAGLWVRIPKKGEK